jgi:phosphatidylserine decarboxylase
MAASLHDNTAPLTSRLGGWLPVDPRHLNKWLESNIAEAEKRNAPLHPVVREFRDMIEKDPVMNMYFTLMFEQQPRSAPKPGSGDVKLENYGQMLVVMNHILTIAPTFDTTGMVGCPINAILDYAMITPAGLAAFADARVNEMLKRLLSAWAEFLDGGASRYVLDDSPSGWLSPVARESIQLHEFQIDPNAEFGGFKSWNDFFIRRFKPESRPVARPGDQKAIVSACESQPYRIQTQVKEHDTFWMKSQPYSLRHMLNGNFVEQFVGGTVYQAFLSAKNYHRWHSPVTGTIRRFQKVPGTYYAEAASERFDSAGPTNSQGYIAHVATRALIFIEADYSGIGLMCFVAVGMVEVSSCVLVDREGKPLEEGQKVEKGDQLGYFQFGGSTHCLVFRPGVISEFATEAIPQGEHGEASPVVKVNSLLAIAS